MAKQKKRAGRKQARERAIQAKARGLPEKEAAEVPAKLRPQMKDASGALRYAAQSTGASAGSSGETSFYQDGGAQGISTIAKLGIGIVVSLALVFGLSQLRKGEVSPPGTGQVVSQTSTSTANTQPAAEEESKKIAESEKTAETSVEQVPGRTPPMQQGADVETAELTENHDQELEISPVRDRAPSLVVPSPSEGKKASISAAAQKRKSAPTTPPISSRIRAVKAKSPPVATSGASASAPKQPVMPRAPVAPQAPQKPVAPKTPVSPQAPSAPQTTVAPQAPASH